MTRIRGFFAVILFTALAAPPFWGWSSTALAQDDDVESTLAVARFQRLSKLGEATDALKAAIDTKIRAVAQTGNFEAVKKLQAEKQKFEESDVLPSSDDFSEPVSAYLATRKAASTQLVAAYRKAIAEYTKQLKIDKAEALDKEMKQFIEDEKKIFSRSVAQAKPSDSVLTKAKETYSSEVDAAKEVVVKKMQSLSNSAKKRGNFDQARQYEQVVTYFKANGKLPETRLIPVQEAKREFDRAKGRSVKKLEEAFNEIISRYEEAGNDLEVAKLKNELKTLADTGETVEEVQAKADQLNEALIGITEALQAAEQGQSIAQKQAIETAKLQQVFKAIQGTATTASFRVSRINPSGSEYYLYLDAPKEMVGTGVRGSTTYLRMPIPARIAANVRPDDMLVMSGRLDLEVGYESNSFPNVIQIGRVSSQATSRSYYIFLRNVRAQFVKGESIVPD